MPTSFESSGPSDEDDHNSWKAIVSSFIIVFVIFLLSTNVLPRGDSALSIPTARSLLHEGNVDLGEYKSVPWVANHYALVPYHGRKVDYFPWLVSASAIPFVAIDDLASLTGLTPSTNKLIKQDHSWVIHYVAAGFWSAMAAVLLAAAVLKFLRRWGVRWNEPHTRLATLVTRLPLLTLSLVIALSTQLWSITSRALNAQGPALACVCGAILLTLKLRTTRHANALAAASGLLCALAFWTRPITAIATVVVTLLIWFDDRRRVTGFIVGLASAHLAILIANQSLLGGRPPYFNASRVGLHSAYAEALAANLVSPSRGLFVFLPQVLIIGALLVPRVRQRFTTGAMRTVVLLLAGSIGVLLLVSTYGAQWWAGHTYGPRYMADALPFLMPLALASTIAVVAVATRAWRTIVIVAWAVAIVVQFQGAWFHSTDCWNAGTRPNIDTSPGRVWSLHDPQITSGFRTLVTSGPASALWTSCANASPPQLP